MSGGRARASPYTTPAESFTITIDRAAIVGRVRLELGVAHDGRNAVERHRAPGEESDAPLELEHAAHRRVEPLHRDLAAIDGAGHRVDRRARVGGLQQQVGAREEGPHARLRAVQVRHAGHVERVGDDQPVEAERVAQDAGEDVGGDGARPELAEVDPGQRDVRRHHDVHARGDRRAERHQLDRVEPRPGRADDGQRQVGVRAGVAVAGEVLGRGEHPVVLEAPHLGRHEPAHVGRILAERAGIDDRVGGIVVDVGHRREGQVHADGAALERGDAADVVGGAVAPGRAHAHIGGKQRPAVEPEAGPALEVRGDEQRERRALLQPVELGRDVERRADGHDDAADVQRIDPRFGAREAVVVVGGVGPRNPRHHQLGDPVADVETGQHGLDVGLGADRAGDGHRARASPPGARDRRRPAGSLRPVRGTWGAQNSRRAGTLRMVARLRDARSRGPDAGTGGRPAGHRRAAERQPAGGARPPGGSRDQPGGRGCPRDQRRGAIAGGRRAARGAVQPRARLPWRGRAGRHGRLVDRFGHRPTNLQSLRPEYRPHRRDARRRRRSCSSICRMRAPDTTPTSSPRSR